MKSGGYLNFCLKIPHHAQNYLTSHITAVRGYDAASSHLFKENPATVYTLNPRHSPTFPLMFLKENISETHHFHSPPPTEMIHRTCATGICKASNYTWLSV